MSKRNNEEQSDEEVIKGIIEDENKLNILTQIAFQSVDIDGSGNIEQPELEKIMAQICMDMGAEIPSKEDVQEVLDDLDSDGNKTIDKDEFKVFIRDILKGMIE